MKVCIVLPCYNEQKTISKVISSIQKTFKTCKHSCQIVVVDDKSTDNSAKLADKTGAFTITHLVNLGVGGATQTGIYYALLNEYDYCITMDSDGQHDPTDALRCLQAAIKNESDLLIGSRLINPKGMSKLKILGNKGLTAFTHILFGVKVTDSQSGLRIFSKKAINVLTWKSTSYDFCSEMLYRAKKLDLKISEAPIKAIYTNYSKQKGQNNWNGVNIIKSLIVQRFMEAIDG